MADDFTREEQAFAAGLRSAAEAEGFRPLDPEAIRAAAPARGARLNSGWFKGLAAAAALVVVVGAGALVLPRLSSGGAPAAAVPEGPDIAAGNAPVPETTTIYDAERTTNGEQSSGEWKDVPDVPLSARSVAAGQWLDGKFYLVGGQLDPPCPPNASCVAPSRLLADGAGYDPATGSWQRIAEAPVPIADGVPVAVAGRLYFQLGSAADTKVYAYDPATDAWANVPAPQGRGSLVAAGDRVASIHHSDEAAGFDELYDPATGEWTRLPDDPLGKSFNRGAVWVNGRLLLFGQELVANPGSEKPAVIRFAELDPAGMTWRLLPDSEVIGGGAVAVGDLVVFPELGSADGGEVNNWGRSYPMGGILDTVSGEWRALPARDASWGEGVTRAWSAAAVSGNRVLASGHLLDPAAGAWTELTAPPGGNLLGQTVVAGPDGLLVFGGWDGEAHTASTRYLPLR